MMLQIVGRFSMGFVAGAIVILAFLLIARSSLVSTVRTPYSEPHSVVLYAGLAPGALFSIALWSPMIIGLLSIAVTKRKIRKAVVLTLAGLASILLLPIVGLVYRMALESLWLGFD
jgi:hypothetical protein